MKASSSSSFLSSVHLTFLGLALSSESRAEPRDDTRRQILFNSFFFNCLRLFVLLKGAVLNVEQLPFHHLLAAVVLVLLVVVLLLLSDTGAGMRRQARRRTTPPPSPISQCQKMKKLRRRGKHCESCRSAAAAAAAFAAFACFGRVHPLRWSLTG